MWVAESMVLLAFLDVDLRGSFLSSPEVWSVWFERLEEWSTSVIAGTVLDAFVGARSWECVADVHTPNSDDVRDSPLGHMVSGEGGTETVGLLSGKIPSPTVVVGAARVALAPIVGSVPGGLGR
ncbi:hypothetical protein V6N11_035578 [Hibiscus sabdariffa]|uniref:Secreted protein n=1 Tax=Hibiscus sabdariffa TaxID=183260 RepID=A0ABR2R0P7_9ROSI